MAEHGGHKDSGEHFVAPKEPEQTAEQAVEAPKHHEQAEKDKPADKAEHHKAHKETKPTQEGNELNHRLATPAQLVDLPPPNKAVKDQARRTTLSKVRRDLKGPEKGFSKFIHAPSVDAISEAAGKTLFRPSGLLIGGLLVLIGSGYYYYLTKHSDFHYSFSIVLVLFVAGFIIGLLFELLSKLFKPKSAKKA